MEQPQHMQVRCQKCGQHAEPTRTILDTRTGRTHHMLECKCGGQNWRADAKPEQTAVALN
jgi:hypothetical protein